MISAVNYKLNLKKMTEQGKKVWKELESMGWSNEPKDFHLEYFEDIIEATKKALTIPAVVGRSEQLVCDCMPDPKCRVENNKVICNGCNKERK